MHINVHGCLGAVEQCSEGAVEQCNGGTVYNCSEVATINKRSIGGMQYRSACTYVYSNSKHKEVFVKVHESKSNVKAGY